MAFGEKPGKSFGGFGPKTTIENDRGSSGGGSGAKISITAGTTNVENKSGVKKTVTFTNVKWNKFDNILVHPSGAEYNEPRNHVVTSGDSIEFHGYNVSEMDEGVYYIIGKDDDFEIECNVDTSKIIPHPGGYFYISFGLISAMINQDGGAFLIDGSPVANVGEKFNMKLICRDSGKYEVFINNKKMGEKFKSATSNVKIVFGFKHDGHNCELLSHAYLKRIKMKQSKGLESGGFGSSGLGGGFGGSALGNSGFGSGGFGNGGFGLK